MGLSGDLQDDPLKKTEETLSAHTLGKWSRSFSHTSGMRSDGQAGSWVKRTIVLAGPN